MRQSKVKKTPTRGIATAIIAGLLILAGLAGNAFAATISWHVDNGNGPLAAANSAGGNLAAAGQRQSDHEARAESAGGFQMRKGQAGRE